MTDQQVAEREPAPRRKIHFPGDKRGIDRAAWVGPCRRGILWRITHVEYDEAQDRSMVIYAPVSPTEVDRVPGLRQKLELIQQSQAAAMGAVAQIGGMQ